MEFLKSAVRGLVIGADAQGEPIRLEIDDALERFNVPGVSIAVIEDAEVVEAAGFGTAGGDPRRRMTESSVGLAGSVSKAVTALGALALAERGVLDLDADINSYLTSWSIPERGGWRSAPSVRQILSHTAGFTVHGFAGCPADAVVPTTREVLDGVLPATNLPVTVDFVPGTAMRYSGGGFVVLQQLIEDVTGEAFSTTMQEVILGPCAMTNSSFENPPSGDPANRTDGHHASGVPVRGGHFVYPERAAAGLWTTASDLGNLISSVQRALRRERAGVSTEVAEQFVTPQVGGRTLGASLVSGCFLHAGADVGHVCSILGSLDGRFGIALMCNSDLGLSLFPWINTAIASHRGWPWPPPSPPPDEHRSAVIPPAGSYDAPGLGPLTITNANQDTVVLEIAGQNPLTLSPHLGRWCHAGLDLTLTYDTGTHQLTIRQTTGSLVADLQK